jgi:hypothetical protein
MNAQTSDANKLEPSAPAARSPWFWIPTLYFGQGIP